MWADTRSDDERLQNNTQAFLDKDSASLDFRQLHLREMAAIENMADDYARQYNLTPDQARRELTRTALSMIDSQWASQEHIHPTERAREALLNESAKEKPISVYGLGEVGWGDSKEIKLFTPGGYFNDTYLFAPEVEQVERNAFFIDGNGNKVYTINPALEHYPSRYGTADGTMPIDSPSAGAMAGQAYDSAVLETTDLFEAVDQRGFGLLGDILDNALNSTNAWAKDVVERGPKAFIPDQVYHGSASEKALVDQLLGNESAQLEHATDNAVFYSEMAGTVITGGVGLGWKAGKEVTEEVVDTAGEVIRREANIPNLSLQGTNDQLALPAPEQPAGLLEYKPDIMDQKPDFYVGPSGPDSTLPATGYRYDRYLNDDGTTNQWGQEVLETGEGRATYIGFEKYETGKEARDAFQIKGPDKVNNLDSEDSSWSDARIRSEFDTLQLYDENGVPRARVPNRLGDTQKNSPEPIAKSYPQYGEGGAQQLHVDGKVLKYNESEILPEE